MRYLDEPPQTWLDGEPPPAYTVPRRRGLRCAHCHRRMNSTPFGFECPRCPTHAGGRLVFLSVEPAAPDEPSDLVAAAADLRAFAARRYGLRVQRPHRPSSRGNDLRHRV